MKPPIVTRGARWKLAAGSGLALLAAACGSGGGTSSGAASPATSSPASVLCADAAALRASLDKLTHIKVGSSTAQEINADLSGVQANLRAFVADASGQAQAQIRALTSALSNLRTGVKDLAASPGSSAVTEVTTALGEVHVAARNLLTTLSTRCPAASGLVTPTLA